MPDTERLEARGPRGEACIIVRSWSRADATDAAGPAAQQRVATYRLGTGERLKPTGDPAVLETLDGKRRFTLA